MSKRKAVEYSNQISAILAYQVPTNFLNLYSKIDLLSSHQLDEHQYFVKACADILGFQISTAPSEQGKQAGYVVDYTRSIPLTSMGEGVANVLGLVVDLCFAKDKIFLIEELENDLHPAALKALLKLVIEKSNDNQFFISTHSNIVMKMLGTVPNSKIFNVLNDVRTKEHPKIMFSRIQEVNDNPIERRQVLEYLGYEFFDFDLWENWLFLEESSAEVIIKKLIDWFVPRLGTKIRTFSANGITKVAEKFEDFNNLFVFLHLQPTYKNRVWVMLDGGVEEKKIIGQMKQIYKASGWNEDQFAQFTKHDFEEYYPAHFSNEIQTVLSIKDKKQKRLKKAELIRSVKEWIKNNEEVAKQEFSQSAKEIIDYLKYLESKM